MLMPRFRFASDMKRDVNEFSVGLVGSMLDR